MAPAVPFSCNTRRTIITSTQKDTTMLILEYIGIDDFSCPTYKDQFGHLWKDIDLGNYDTPSLYSVSNNDLDGEPMYPLKQEHSFRPAPYQRNKNEFQYMLLSRMQSDCEYYLGYGNRSPRILSENPQGHIDHMKKLWEDFPAQEKPEWLTWEQILEYEQKICTARN